MLLSAAPTSSLAQDTLSTREREALSPRAANRTVEHDLLSVLEPIDGFKSGMLRRLHGVVLLTRPYGTEFPGVCRRDQVSLLYAPTDQKGAYEDHPVRPYGFEAMALFHIEALPDRAFDDDADHTMGRSDCEKAGRDEDANWFVAANAREAVQGARALLLAVAAIRAGSL